MHGDRVGEEQRSDGRCRAVVDLMPLRESWPGGEPVQRSSCDGWSDGVHGATLDGRASPSSWASGAPCSEALRFISLRRADGVPIQCAPSHFAAVSVGPWDCRRFHTDILDVAESLSSHPPPVAGSMLPPVETVPANIVSAGESVDSGESGSRRGAASRRDTQIFPAAHRRLEDLAIWADRRTARSPSCRPMSMPGRRVFRCGRGG
ncbi:MAG: hypothetical protein ACLSUZ_04990 [Bifidobacterium pseudocatenulatum]